MHLTPKETDRLLLFLAAELARQLDATIFPLDLYYRDLSHFPLDSRHKCNFDHPDSFDTELLAAVAETQENGETVALVMIDIDHFKSFNDTWGHQTGDQVLRLVAQCMSENVKGRDTVARFGGEEFAIILRRTTLEHATRLADQIRAYVESKKLIKRSTGDVLGTITVSAGVARLGERDTPASLIQRADSCLYRAKNTGRNRVVGEDESDLSEMDAA